MKQKKGYSYGANKYMSELEKIVGKDDPITNDLILKVGEQWDCYKTTSELLQKYFDQTGQLTITQPSGQIKAHPLAAMQQQYLKSYLSLVSSLEARAGTKIPEADEVDSFFSEV